MARPGGKDIASAVRETLDSVVSPSVRDAILARALAAGQMDRVPTDAARLGEFVQGPLHDSLVQSLGPALGVSVTTELERIVALAAPAATARAERETLREPKPKRPSTKLPATAPGRRPSRSTMPSREFLPPGGSTTRDGRWAENEYRAISPTVPARRGVSGDASALPAQGAGPSRRAQPVSADFPAGTARVLGVIGTASVEPSVSGRPIVFVASTDPELLRCFQAWLDLKADVKPVTGAKELFFALTANEGNRTVVVLDGKNPSLRPLILAAMAEEMSEQTQVLLWGVAPHVQAKMRNVSSATERWLVYGADATTNELVAGCAKLVG